MKLKNFVFHMILVVAVIILLSLFFRRSLELVLQYDSLILNLIFILIPMLTRFGMNKSLKYFGIPFKEDVAEKDRKEAILFFKSMITYLMLSSLIVSISVCCFYLGNLDNTLGRFLATGLITPLYASLICVSVFIPFRDSLEKSLISEE